VVPRDPDRVERQPLHGLTLQGFAVGVWIDPFTGARGDELPTHQTLADNVISGLVILGFGEFGIWTHSPASPDCGLPMPDPCRTYITFANTTITGNTIEARTGIKLVVANSGDRIAGATVTGNTIRIRDGIEGISVESLGNAGDDGTPARISEVLIARNSIEGIGVVGIQVTAGSTRVQGSITEGVRVLDNRVHVVCRGSEECNGITLGAGTDASSAIFPDVDPIRYPDGNVLRNVEVAGNRLSGDLTKGVWVSAGSASAAGSRNRVLDVQIKRNVISSTIVGAGVLLQVGGTEGPAPNLHRYATGNRITGVEISENRISIGRTRPPGFGQWHLDVGGGIVLLGGVNFSRDGRIRDVRIAKNEIKVKFEAVHGGIKVTGGMGPTARGNRVTCVRLSANHVSGTRPAVSVRSNIDAKTNYASLGGC